MDSNAKCCHGLATAGAFSSVSLCQLHRVRVASVLWGCRLPGGTRWHQAHDQGRAKRPQGQHGDCLRALRICSRGRTCRRPPAPKDDGLPIHRVYLSAAGAPLTWLLQTFVVPDISNDDLAHRNAVRDCKSPELMGAEGWSLFASGSSCAHVICMSFGDRGRCQVACNETGGVCMWAEAYAIGCRTSGSRHTGCHACWRRWHDAAAGRHSPPCIHPPGVRRCLSLCVFLTLHRTAPRLVPSMPNFETHDLGIRCKNSGITPATLHISTCTWQLSCRE